MHMLVCVRASSIQPHRHLSALTLSTPIKMPCRSLDLSSPLSPPRRAFCVAQRRGNEIRRERQRGIGGLGWWGYSSCCWLVVSDLWEHLLNLRRARVLPKMLHFSLLSPVLLVPNHHHDLMITCVVVISLFVAFIVFIFLSPFYVFHLCTFLISHLFACFSQ